MSPICVEPYQYGLLIWFLAINPWPFTISYWNINNEHIEPLKFFSAIFIYIIIIIPIITIDIENPKNIIKQVNLNFFGFLLFFFNKHFGLHEQIHIDIHIPIHTNANIKIKIYGKNIKIISIKDILPSIISNKVNSL